MQGACDKMSTLYSDLQFANEDWRLDFDNPNSLKTSFDQISESYVAKSCS